MDKKKLGAIVTIVIALVLVVSVVITINPTVKYNEDGTYAHFTENDSYVSVFKHPAFEGYGRFLIPLSTDIGRSFGVFGKIGTTNGAWSCNQDLLEAVNACIDQVNTGDPLFYDYYTAEEIAADNSKADTCIAFLKGEPGKPFIVLNGGGGYQDVAFLAEGISSGVPFWEAGYNVFVVKYRAEFDLPNELGMSGFDIAIGDLGRAMQFIYSVAFAYLKEAIDAHLELDFYIYAASGNANDAPMLREQMKYFIEQTDAFSYGNDPSINNLYYTISDFRHADLYAPYYFYNILQVVFH